MLLNSFSMIFSFPSFALPCKCTEACIDVGKTQCKISKSNRKYCKYCRYQKCLDLAGMKGNLAIEDKRNQKTTITVPTNHRTNLSKSNTPVELVDKQQVITSNIR